MMTQPELTTLKATLIELKHHWVECGIPKAELRRVDELVEAISRNNVKPLNWHGRKEAFNG